MKKLRTPHRIALVGSLALAAVATSLSSTGATTSTQVNQGLQVYQQQCISCHGAELEGGQGPTLWGDDFMRKWRDVDQLRDFIQRNMPFGAGGSLTQEQALNAAAYIFNENRVRPDGFAHPEFKDQWTAADQPVASFQTKRSWLWGPEGFQTAWEEYAEAPGGKRLVQYFDKTRMEITRINAPRDNADYVTNGLLATELVTGRLQKGDAVFEQRTPAAVNVAGDPDDPNAPTYASFSRLLDRTEERKAAVMATVDRAGNVGQNGALGNYTDYVYYVPETGHNIPSVFWDYLNSEGPVNKDGQTVTGPIFEPWWAPVGFPITEAYWTRAKVAGVERDVLVQVFQRRVLTYTPDNDEGFKVEMGNVGRHYHTWRYGG